MVVASCKGKFDMRRIMPLELFANIKLIPPVSSHTYTEIRTQRGFVIFIFFFDDEGLQACTFPLSHTYRAITESCGTLVVASRGFLHNWGFVFILLKKIFSHSLDLYACESYFWIWIYLVTYISWWLPKRLIISFVMLNLIDSQYPKHT